MQYCAFSLKFSSVHSFNPTKSCISSFADKCPLDAIYGKRFGCPETYTVDDFLDSLSAIFKLIFKF